MVCALGLLLLGQTEEYRTRRAALRKALPEGVPGLPSPQGIKNLIEYDVKAPLKIKEDVPVEKVMQLRLMREVKEELERRR